MINPANYYNPFAKYNYVSKTRGAYVPQNAQLWSEVKPADSADKSTNIWSGNYDAELDIQQSMENSKTDNTLGSLFGIFFKNKDEN